MKKTVPFFALLIICQLSIAQTITADWVPRTGEAISSFVGAVDNTLTPGESGQNVVWDYSAVVANDTVPAIPFTYTDAATTTYASEFPDANLALVPDTDSFANTFVTYYGLSADEFSIQGNATEFSRTVYTDPQIIMRFPFSFGDSFEDDFTGTTSIIGEFTSETDFSGSGMVSYDATGKIITPSGTFDNVARIYQSTTRKDSNTIAGGITLISTIQTESYLWLQDRIGTAVANLSISNTTTETIVMGLPPQISEGTDIISFSWLNADGMTSSREDIHSSDFTVSQVRPNPFDAEITLEIQSPCQCDVDVSLQAINGQTILNREYELLPQQNVLRLNTQDIIPGTYLVVLQYDQGIISQKIVKTD